MSSPTVGPQLGPGLTSLVLSKKYLSCAAQPPAHHAYKLEHEIKENEDRGCGGWSPTALTAWAPGPPPQQQPIVAVQARYEPSDVFTPLVFEEILQQQHQQQQQPPTAPVWMRPPAEQRIGAQQHVVHHQHQHLHHHHHHNTRQQAAHPTQHAVAAPLAGGHQVRRPLQHLPPAAQSTLQPPANNKSDQLHHQQQQQHQQQQHAAGGNKPGDLSWLVNFQVASIFEPSCNATVGATAGNALFGGDWHGREQSDTSKSCGNKKKTPKTDCQKPSSKISRKPYRMPPSRLDKANKPGYTYTEMIHQALMEKKELPVAEIYQWISSHFPYFREDDERWKNSVRHNLSINPNFRKGRKSQGAGHYWRLCNIEESLGHREYSTAIEDVSSSPQDSVELEQACKYLEGELQREDSLEDVKMHTSIDTELENEIYTNSFLISSPPKYVNEQISISNNNDFHSYSENLLEEPIDFQYYNL